MYTSVGLNPDWVWVLLEFLWNHRDTRIQFLNAVIESYLKKKKKTSGHSLAKWLISSRQLTHYVSIIANTFCSNNNSNRSKQYRSFDLQRTSFNVNCFNILLHSLYSIVLTIAFIFGITAAPQSLYKNLLIIYDG